MNFAYQTLIKKIVFWMKPDAHVEVPPFLVVRVL